jgi:hypothetical protein
VSSLLKLALRFCRRFLNDPTPFLHFCDYLPFEKDLALHFSKLEFSAPNDNLDQVWLNLACWFLRKRFLNIFSVFSLFCHYLPLEKGNPLPLYKLESPSTKDDLCQIWFKLVQWFWRERFLNDSTPFLHFCDYLPFEEDKLEFHSHKDNLYQVWLNLACWFWRRFFKNFSVFLLFRYYLPLEKGNPLHLNKLEFPTSKDDLCQVWLKLVQWFWRSWKWKKFTDRRTDRWTPGDQKSSPELSAQVS